MNLNMKYAIVTGGSKGIGKQISLDLLRKGFFVITNFSSDKESANIAENDFSEISENYRLIKSDQSDINQLNDFILQIKAITSKINCIVCNTGITIRKNFNQFTNDEWEKAFMVNIHSHFYIIRDVDDILQPSSSIIFIGSAMGELPHATSLVYGVTKTAIHSMAKNLVKFYTDKQITVNVIAPGFVETEWQKDKLLEIRYSIYSKTACNRFATAEEISQVCMMLLENRFINGEVIKVDGGYNFH